MAFFVWRGNDIMLFWLHPVISSYWDQRIPSEHTNNGECDRIMKILSGGLCFDLTQIWLNYFQCSQYRPLNKNKFLGKEKGKWDKEERGRREIWKDISLSVLHCSLTSQATALLSQFLQLPTISSNTFEYLNFCGHSLPKPTFRIFWAQFLQLNFQALPLNKNGYKLETFLLMLQDDLG